MVKPVPVLLLGVFLSSVGFAQKRYQNLTEEEAARLWLEEIVPYIVTKQEREIFQSLTTSEQWVRFIDTFWARRDPRPETPENEFKLEHYRRIAFANKFFGAGRPGWKTDRGRIYILLGAPDEIDADPMGRFSHQYPTEVWTYRNPPHPQLPPYLEIAFVDRYGTGDFEITFNLLKDADASRQREALLGEPGFDPWTAMEIRSLNFGRPGTVTSLADGLYPELERLSELALVSQIPERQLLPLSERVSTDFTFDTGPLDEGTRIDFYLAGEGQVSIPVTLRLSYRDFAYLEMEDRYQGRFEVLARISRSDGEIVNEFHREERFTIPRDQPREEFFVYQALLHAPPGEYELQLVVRDNTSNRIRTAERSLRVPELGRDLSLSTAVLASRIEKLDEPPPSGAKEPFVFGDYKVVPNPERFFEAGGTLNLYFEVYNLSLDEKGKNAIGVSYVFRRQGRLFRNVPDTYLYPTESRQRSVISAIPLKDFTPGEYLIQISVTDRVVQRSVTAEVDFRISGPPDGGLRR